MNYRVTIGLVVVALLLGGAVFAFDVKPPTPTPAAKSTPLFSFLSVDVSEMSATSQGKATVATRSEDGQWMLQRPEVAPADRVRLDSLIARLSALNATRTIDSAALADFGLAAPRAELRVKTRTAQEYVLLVGDDTPDKSGSYAMLPDSRTVYVLGAAIGGDIVRLVTEPPKATPTPTVVVPNLTPLPTAAPKPTGATSEASPTPIVLQVLPPTPAPAASPTQAPAASVTPATKP
jgi:hypothetical protein